MSPPKLVQDLVARFRENIQDYTEGSYKEFRLRKEFIDPLFASLGWDVANTHGYAEAYKDVVHEDAIKIAGGTKAPDYAFRVGGVRKFFVETKAPAVSLKDNAEAAFQLRRYAWSAKLPISILTNFQDFAVYDCRKRPEKNDKASVGRILSLSFEEYQTRWNEIEGTFSREAVLKGAFDRFARDNARKRGTVEVDDAFLEEIEQWRSTLAKNIAKHNAGISVRDLNAAVQRTIDRIIFLRIAEARGIEPYGKLRELVDGKNVYERLGKIFTAADARYNSGLFHFRKGDGADETLDSFTLELSIDDKVLKPIFSHLYYPDSPYEFSVLPADILGQVYEQFLGKVIALNGSNAVVEEKPEVKKAGGVYYTPSHVVKYIVGSSLGAALDGKTPAQAGGLAGRSKAAQPLRILDPACGSGSFLIGVYQYLLDWYRDQYVKEGLEKHSRGRDPKLYQVSSTEWHLTIAEKRRILLTHIFGVDVDPQAVEVTKLSLLLKVLEGESSDAIASQMDMFHMRALPDLGNNIKCGNSLIDSSFYKYFKRDLFSLEDKLTLNVMDWDRSFPSAMDRSGFDVVVGNPPYLYSAGKEYDDYFAAKYLYAQYQTDFYVYFIERSIALLKPGGSLSFIVPDSWMNSETFTKIRDLLINKNSLEKVCVYRYFVFKKANIENTVFFLHKSKPKDSLNIELSLSPTEIVTRPPLLRADVNRLGIVNPFYSKTAEQILKLVEKHAPIGDRYDINRGIHAYRTDGYGRSKFQKGVQTKRDKEERSYHADKRIDKTYLPEIRGRDVHWLTYNTSGEFLSYGPWLAEPREEKYFKGPRIMLRKVLGPILSCAYIEEAAAIDQALYIAVPKQGDTAEIKHLLGVLGSEFGAWYLRTKYAIYDLLHPWYTKKQLLTIPLPDVDAELVKLVDEATTLIAVGARTNTEGDRRVVDEEIASIRESISDRVFDLYALSGNQRRTIREELTSGAAAGVNLTD